MFGHTITIFQLRQQEVGQSWWLREVNFVGPNMGKNSNALKYVRNIVAGPKMGINYSSPL
jgi:hypothetical protein